MGLTYRIISIGTLSKNRFWQETEKKRVAHATTTLIRDNSTTILVDPSLPAELLTQRLDERAGLTPKDIDVVFLTSFRPIHRRSIELFDGASCFMNEVEIKANQAHLSELDRQSDSQPQELRNLLVQEKSLLTRIEPAAEKITKQVHLFPCPGITPGSAGLLLTLPTRTIVVAGDGVVTQDYCQAGQVYEQVVDIELARESLADIIEIADEIVPGHDNLFSIIGR